MNDTEYTAHILARTIRTGDDKLITKAFSQLKFGTVPMDILEQHNFPYIVQRHAPNNQLALSMASNYQNFKLQKIEHEKPWMLKRFADSTFEEYPDGIVSVHTLKLLTAVSFFTDLDFVKCSFSILSRLDLLVEDFEKYGILERAKVFEHQIQEAAWLVRKYQRLKDEVESEVEEESEETEVAPSLDRRYPPIHGDFTHNRMEIEMIFLAQCIKAGNEEMISTAIEFVGTDELPLEFYRKYDIALSCHLYCPEQEDCKHLIDFIEEMEEVGMQWENLEALERYLRENSELGLVPDSVMTLLMGYFKGDRYLGDEDWKDYFVDPICNFFLSQDVSLDQFERFDVKNILVKFEERATKPVKLVLQKIEDLKSA
ncbi:SEC-C motif-containing protein [Caenorhabditis elegans]|uniref:SEC-C motif-containing protein n=1 Tax=Caenorhabditis elegans TaxID=6239 RepID=Q9XWH5_CAEEL|nr:SEC-C motif-containing protein [Caenorhabditis elegans]CAA21693.1 SEC-C motif-containing protein [Caenorhabditis elegans]|eukprot:NP_496629.1 Uncharacterized protein CELE_Y57A10B.6 [Caenorhabditis elegans]